jgi:uncharacterized protein YceH (UPF0502 family)
MLRELSAEEIRVLGCLVEKEATTPDNYPLSSNALVNACNQSTSRDPVVSYSERQIDQVMLTLRDEGLARTVRGDGQRVHKHKHVLNEAWRLSRAELAVLCVLMLRGPQTVNELRTRTERFDLGSESDTIERTLGALAARDEPFVRLLERRSGEREARWIHLVGGEAMADDQAAASSSGDDVHARPGTRSREVAGGVDTAANVAMVAEVAVLTERLDALGRRFDALLERLGETID